MILSFLTYFCVMIYAIVKDRKDTKKVCSWQEKLSSISSYFQFENIISFSKQILNFLAYCTIYGG